VKNKLRVQLSYYYLYSWLSTHSGRYSMLWKS